MEGVRYLISYHGAHYLPATAHGVDAKPQLTAGLELKSPALGKPVSGSVAREKRHPRPLPVADDNVVARRTERG